MEVIRIPAVRLIFVIVPPLIALVLGLPWMRQVMGFAPPTASMAVAVALMVAAIAAWLGALRWWRLGRADHQHGHG
jgi:hypothetical protein